MVNFLDVTLNLNTDLYNPFHEPNKSLSYINVSSNHPKPTIDGIEIIISIRISNLSANKEIFYQHAPGDNDALKLSGFKTKISHLPNTSWLVYHMTVSQKVWRNAML